MAMLKKPTNNPNPEPGQKCLRLMTRRPIGTVIEYENGQVLVDFGHFKQSFDPQFLNWDVPDFGEPEKNSE